MEANVCADMLANIGCEQREALIKLKYYLQITIKNSKILF